MIEKLKSYDYLLILICIYLARIIIFHPSFADSLIFVAALGYLSYSKYINQVKAVKINEDMLEKINKMEEIVTETRSSMNAIKMSGSMGAGGVRFK
ncbi:MAG: hypothetical protein ACOYOV_00340 [Bacteroidales bacterium]